MEQDRLNELGHTKSDIAIIRTMLLISLHSSIDSILRSSDRNAAYRIHNSEQISSYNSDSRPEIDCSTAHDNFAKFPFEWGVEMHDRYLKEYFKIN